MNKADTTCVLKVKESKVFCETHNCFHDIDPTPFKSHKGHEEKLISVTFYHVCYTGSVCPVCNDGKLVVDSDQ